MTLESDIDPTRPATARGPLTVLIADDHVAWRDGVAAELRERGFDVVAEVGDAESAVAAAVRERPDLCLIDLEMPGTGISAVTQIARRVPTTSVIVLTVSDRREDMLSSLERGGVGYLVKGMGGAELAKTLRAAYNGEAAVQRALIPHLVDRVRHGPRRTLTMPTGRVQLSHREWDVAEMLRDGRTTDEIALGLGLSPVTIRRHVARLLAKMGAPDRASAIEALRIYRS